jgi:hypothetical protein
MPCQARQRKKWMPATSMGVTSNWRFSFLVTGGGSGNGRKSWDIGSRFPQRALTGFRNQSKVVRILGWSLLWKLQSLRHRSFD